MAVTITRTHRGTNGGMARLSWLGLGGWLNTKTGLVYPVVKVQN